MFETDPISRIEWRDAHSLSANNYNPNTVMSPEMRLLERSILLTGFVQPILITADGTIIDGFHRTTLARVSAPLRERYKGLVPCAVLDVTRDQAMILTIRMNRAKGTHVAISMSKIVRELLDQHGYDPAELALEIGATKDEIDLLHQDGVFKHKNIADWSYSSAWYPIEKGDEPGEKTS
jgi:ParB-like chromosome segregation protein Spo0J